MNEEFNGASHVAPVGTRTVPYRPPVPRCAYRCQGVSPWQPLHHATRDHETGLRGRYERPSSTAQVRMKASRVPAQGQPRQNPATRAENLAVQTIRPERPSMTNDGQQRHQRRAQAHQGIGQDRQRDQKKNKSSQSDLLSRFNLDSRTSFRTARRSGVLFHRCAGSIDLRLRARLIGTWPNSSSLPR